MPTIFRVGRPGSWIGVIVLCGAVWATTDAGPTSEPFVRAESVATPSSEVVRQIERQEIFHRQRLERGESPGTVAVLRLLEIRRERLEPDQETAAPLQLPERRLFEPPWKVLVPDNAGRVAEILLDWQFERVVEQLSSGSSGVFCQCYCDEACDNGYFCDGPEHCGFWSGCGSGAAPSCDDFDECTSDWCNEAADRCDHDLVPPPAEVQGLELDLADPVVASLFWQPVSGAETYNVYSGEQPSFADLTCFIQGVEQTSTNDDGVMPTGDVLVYLVTASHCGESTLGSDSEGTPRANEMPCP